MPQPPPPPPDFSPAALAALYSSPSAPSYTSPPPPPSFASPLASSPASFREIPVASGMEHRPAAASVMMMTMNGGEQLSAEFSDPQMDSSSWSAASSFVLFSAHTVSCLKILYGSLHFLFFWGSMFCVWLPFLDMETSLELKAKICTTSLMDSFLLKKTL